MRTAAQVESEHRAKEKKVPPQTQFALKSFVSNHLAVSKANFPKPIGLWNQWLTDPESQSQSQFR
jgi:hypothetical protein